MSKKKLYQRLLELEKENERLKEENAYLKFQMEELRAKRYKSKKEKPPEDETPKPPPKKKGGLFGHAGFFRKKPKRIDRVEEVRLDKCPICGNTHLSECKDTEVHIQEDIILPKTETTLYKKYRYYCKHCKRVVSGRGKTELPKGNIGPVAKSLAVFFKYAVKISDNDIVNIFDKAFGLAIKPSSVVGFRDQLKNQAQDTYQQLLAALKSSDFIHADETGWGLMGWLWKFSNKNISITHIDKSRGQRVVEHILGKDYEGILISDFLSACNKITTKAKQRCLIHLLRDLKEGDPILA